MRRQLPTRGFAWNAEGSAEVLHYCCPDAEHHASSGKGDTAQDKQAHSVFLGDGLIVQNSVFSQSTPLPILIHV